MFEQIRTKLTYVYTAIFTIFLLVFVISTFFVLIYTFVKVETEDMNAYASHEAEEYILEEEAPATDEEVFSGKILFYITNAEQQIVLDKLTVTPVGSSLINSPYKLILSENTVFLFTQGNSDAPQLYISTTTKLIKNDVFIGDLVMYKNINQYQTIILNFILLVSFLILVFIVFASILGYYIAGKNIRPLKKSFAQQQEFVSNVSHEIFTPLSVILLSAESLELDSQSIYSIAARSTIENIKEEVRYLNRITRSLLQLSTLDSEKNTDLKVRLDLAAFLLRLKITFEKIALKKQIKLILETNPEKLLIKANSDQLTQVLNILLDNAIKYSEPYTTITLSSKKIAEKYIEIIVADQGPGINPENLEKIFSRFFRADESRTRKQEGFGLGLSIAKLIVQNHQGEIRAESSLGLGSKFIIRLPLGKLFH